MIMILRYIVLAGNPKRYLSGWGAYQGEAPTMEAALEIAQKFEESEGIPCWYEIIDLMTKEITVSK